MAKFKTHVATRNMGANSAFARSLIEVATPTIRALMQATADDAVARCDAIVEAEFNNARPEGRRRKGTKHLLGSFTGTAVLVDDGSTLGRIELRSSAPAAKVNALNQGSGEHQIGADGRWLSFPASELGGQYKGNAAYFKKRKAYGAAGSRRVAVRGPVTHPGTRASHFMERSMEQAVRARLRTPVTIPRR